MKNYTQYLFVLVFLWLGKVDSQEIPYRTIKEISPKNGSTTIILDDGSRWETNGFFSKKEAAVMKKNDFVILYPESTHSKKERFYIYNDLTHGKCYVNIAMDVPLQTINSFTLVSFCSESVCVKNQKGDKFSFYVDSHYFPLVDNWDKKDVISLGKNNKNEDIYPYILVNITKDQYIQTSHLLKGT